MATKQLEKHKKVQNLERNPRDLKKKNMDDSSWGIIIIRCRSDLARICAWQGNHNEAFPTRLKTKIFGAQTLRSPQNYFLYAHQKSYYISKPKCNPILQVPKTRIKQNNHFFDKVKASKCRSHELRSNILFWRKLTFLSRQGLNFKIVLCFSD